MRADAPVEGVHSDHPLLEPLPSVWNSRMSSCGTHMFHQKGPTPHVGRCQRPWKDQRQRPGSPMPNTIYIYTYIYTSYNYNYSYNYIS